MGIFLVSSQAVAGMGIMVTLYLELAGRGKKHKEKG
jgi:hypothetical protein